ncbi:zinc-binding dehydrogenase [Yinghuangia aomiensis]
MPVPFAPGSNVAGVVAAVGPDCARFAVGDRVHGIGVRRRFRRTRARVRGAVARHRPDGLGHDLRVPRPAATTGRPTTRLSPLLASAAGETPRRSLGASGAVGSAAIGAASKAFGARVIACASSPEKLEFCRTAGADEAVPYTEPDFKDRLKAACGERGADVVLDTVGGEYAEPALRATGYGGRYVVIGFAAGEVPRVPLNLVLLKGSTILGYEIGAFQTPPPRRSRDQPRDLEAMAHRRPPPSRRSRRRYALESAAEAMRTVAGRAKYGDDCGGGVGADGRGAIVTA